MRWDRNVVPPAIVRTDQCPLRFNTDVATAHVIVCFFADKEPIKGKGRSTQRERPHARPLKPTKGSGPCFPGTTTNMASRWNHMGSASKSSRIRTVSILREPTYRSFVAARFTAGRRRSKVVIGELAPLLFDLGSAKLLPASFNAISTHCGSPFSDEEAPAFEGEGPGLLGLNGG